MARSWPWSASPASASRASSRSSATRTAPRAGWSSRAPRSRTARRPRYLPVIELLGAYFRIEARDDPRRPREGDRQAADARPGAASRPAGAPRRCSTSPSRTRSGSALDPPQRRQQTLDAVKRLLLRESQVQPLLLVFEDLHWIDAETQALLDAWSRACRRAHPAARQLPAGVPARLGHKTYYRQLRIDPLPARERRRAARHPARSRSHACSPLKRPRSSGPRATRSSWRRASGPSSRRGRSSAIAGPTAWRPLEAIQVPATVQAILAARIDRLAPEEKQLLQAAAVVGKDVRSRCSRPSPSSRRGAPTPASPSSRPPSSCTRPPLPELEYTFKHALTHEVAYRNLLGDRRARAPRTDRRGHRAALADRSSEQVERLAHHAHGGGELERASVSP